jgi:uncharacterized protein YndB with AHSA1/START domain
MNKTKPASPGSSRADTAADTSTVRTSDRIEKRITLHAPIARVWRALTDVREFSRWFGFTLDGPFLPGRVIRGTFDGALNEAAIMDAQRAAGVTPSRLKMPQGRFVFGTIERVEPQHTFSYRWIPYGIDAEADLENEPTTLVEFRLEEDGDKTRLTVVESGFDAVPPHRRARAFHMNSGGWSAQVENLRRHVEPV